MNLLGRLALVVCVVVAAQGCGGEVETPLASQCTIREIALYQAVKVPLMLDGLPADDSHIPIVQGRPGIVRIYVDDLVADRCGDSLRVDAEIHLVGEDDRELEVISAKSQSVTTALEDHPQTTIALRFDGSTISSSIFSPSRA